MYKMDHDSAYRVMKFMMTMSRMKLNDDPWAEIMVKLYDMDKKLSAIVLLANTANQFTKETNSDSGDNNE